MYVRTYHLLIKTHVLRPALPVRVVYRSREVVVGMLELTLPRLSLRILRTHPFHLRIPVHPFLPQLPATTSGHPSPSSSNSVSQSPLSHPLSSLAPSSDHVDVCHFPPPEPVADANFVWGVLDARSFCKVISEAYSEVVHWRKDYFRVPNGSSGKDFVSELARLFKAYAVQSSLESIALKAISVACVLLLQRPPPNAKASDSSS